MTTAPSSLALWLENKLPANSVRAAAIINHSQSPAVIGVTADGASNAGWQKFIEKNGENKREIIERSQFLDRLLPVPSKRVIHTETFLDARLAWARRHSPERSFALCGIADRAMCHPDVFDAIGKLITAPFHSFDALVCSSHAVKQFVASTAEYYAEFLAERIGGKPQLLPRLEVIPPGVDSEAFRPPSPAERKQCRDALSIAPEEFVVLCAGPLSFHSRVNPYPLYHGLYQAARTKHTQIRLLLAGSAPNASIRTAFLNGARVFAPTVTTVVVDDAAPGQSAWHAADLYAFLPDSFAECFDTSLIRAMACGLPVVASDWGGVRDAVADGETGILIPAKLMPDSLPNVVNRLQLGDLSPDRFLAQASQTIVVDCEATMQAITQLIDNDHLRARLGAAGRERVVHNFTWEQIVRLLDQLWHEQETEFLNQTKVSPARRKKGKNSKATDSPNTQPSLYPLIEHSFAGFPTQYYAENEQVCAVPEMETRLHRLLNMASTQYESHIRSDDPRLLCDILKATKEPCTIANLDQLLRQAGLNPSKGRATIAWLLKYGLLREK